MKITEKINMDTFALMEHGPITIVAFGDSVTHGCVANDEMNYETVYWNRLRKKINAVRNYVPVNVINAGISGLTAKMSLDRMESQVFSHNPDLIIVCFGLNDVNEPLEDYLSSLKTIFSGCNERGFETIFMTPNSFNTRVAEDTAECHLAYAAITAEMQNGGKMDLYMNSACDLARSMGITVCDCYAEWKRLSETEDVTMLLANRINHPSKEMHEMFANKLFEIIFADMPEVIVKNSSSMWDRK